MSTDPTDAMERLLDKERELEADMRALTEPQQDQGSISFGKRVGDGTAMAVDRLNAVRVHERLTTTLAEVRRALVKAREGTRDECDVCGGAIGEERLEARLWATRCIRHG